MGKRSLAKILLLFPIYWKKDPNFLIWVFYIMSFFLSVKGLYYFVHVEIGDTLFQKKKKKEKEKEKVEKESPFYQC